jgi:hypothetical protein
MFISLGPMCHPAGNLKRLNLRKQSLPFDWLLCSEDRGFEYINNLINTNFSKFTTNLIYNHRKKVISKNYDYVEFFHHDLLKNVSDIKEESKETLIEVMNKRGDRFINIISNKINKVIFLYMLHHTTLIKNGLINNRKLYEDMINFNTNLNIKCNFKVLVYLYNDNKDYNLILPDELNNLNNFIFDKYIRNQTVNKTYGSMNDFKQLLKKNKLL